MSKSRTSGAPQKAAPAANTAPAAPAPASNAKNEQAETVRYVENQWRQKAPRFTDSRIVRQDGIQLVQAMDKLDDLRGTNGMSYLVYDKSLDTNKQIRVPNASNTGWVTGNDTGFGGMRTAGNINATDIAEVVKNDLKEMRVTGGGRTYVLRQLTDKTYNNRGKFAQAYGNALRKINSNWSPIDKPSANPLNPRQDPNSPKNAREWLTKNAKKYGYEFYVK